ncbi:disintegrin and metalloproteinase domain-containing protein 18, partial [Sigmodon hispidus]
NYGSSEWTAHCCPSHSPTPQVKWSTSTSTIAFVIPRCWSLKIFSLFCISFFSWKGGQEPERPVRNAKIILKSNIDYENTLEEKGSVMTVTYVIRIDGKAYTFHLEKQSFLHPRFKAYFHSKLGTMQPDSLIKYVEGIEDHCFYQGHASEIPASVVTLSTCSGLRGLLQLENITYGIEPLESSANFEHIIYQIKNNKIDYSPLEENIHSQHESQSYRILVKPEKAMYDHMGSEIGVAVQKVIHIFGLVNNIFSQLKMTVILKSLEIWSDHNKIETYGDADEVLQRFLLWKRKQASKRARDITYLLLYKDNPDYIGATYQGMACNPNFTAAIALYFNFGVYVTISFVESTLLTTSKLGINLGITYDDIYNCFCPGSTCIMNPSAIHAQGIKIFSSCKVHEEALYSRLLPLNCELGRLRQREGLWLSTFLKPNPVSQVLLGIEMIQEDNGFNSNRKEECSHPDCCNAETCVLKSQAECGTGACCDRRTCKIAERGRLCRKSKDLCDFPEFCNGISEFCVPDTLAADLEPCNNETAFCFGGICRDLDRQCMDLLGKHQQGLDAKSSNYLCAQEVNLQNDKFGNCHGRCNYSALFCGKVTCTWDRVEILNSETYDFQYTYLGGHVCVSAYLRDSSLVDHTYVRDGTICGDGKVCIRGSCLRVHAYRKSLHCNSQEKCQGNGICNNLHNCHCDPGYAPPECDMTLSSPGGSLDDGFWLPYDKSIPLVVDHRRARYKKGLLISFYCFLPFLLMFAIFVIRRNITEQYRHKEEKKLGSLQASIAERRAPDSEEICLNVTVPMKTEPGKGSLTEGKVSYVITVGGKPHSLHLRNYSFLSQDFLVYAYNETGSLYSDSSHFMTNCHYRGYVAEFPNSTVTLNICSGLRGFLQFENISYGIEPLESSARFEHIVYQVQSGNPVLAENYSHVWQTDHIDEDLLDAQDKSHPQLLPQSLKLHIIVGKYLYDYMGSDNMAITQKIFQIIGLVNTMLTQLELTVVLASLELWSDKNQISTDGDANDILQRLLDWRRDYLTRQSHEITHLYIYRKHPAYIGATLPGEICNKSYAAGIVMYPEDMSLEGFSVVITQLIGLHIGLSFDDVNNCSCPRAPCIMQQEALSSSGMKTFSNCSMQDYKNYASKIVVKCLGNLSNIQLLQQNQPVCGDGIVEANEECDCGNDTECQFKECCNYETCKLKDSAKCGSGPCCTSNCELSAGGTPCRKAVDPECDFTEYCNGSSSHCVPDTFAMNGHLCRLGSAYCYNGRCQALNDQCVHLFGKGSQGASYACFEKVNSPREKLANCGFNNSYPLPCGQKDVLCGKLACFQPHKNYKSTAQSVVYSYVHDNVCLSIPPGLSMRSDGRDYAYVADGTVCGPQMYCINRTCKEINLAEHDCDATKKCKGNGICNNFGNCQCFPDYRPPDCNLQIGSPGGSIDDGNILRSESHSLHQKDATVFSSEWTKGENVCSNSSVIPGYSLNLGLL